MYIFLGEKSIHVFCPFSNWIVWVFSLLSVESALYILDTSSLLDMRFRPIFSQAVACLFIFLTGSLSKSRFFILM